jgi:NACalpha-BTF3-like transcription factor
MTESKSDARSDPERKQTSLDIIKKRIEKGEEDCSGLTDEERIEVVMWMANSNREAAVKALHNNNDIVGAIMELM